MSVNWRLCVLAALAKNSNRQSNTGLTLIELLVVIIIVGVLASIALPNLLAQVDKARYSEAYVQMSAIKKDLIRRKLELGAFPTDMNRNQVPRGINYFPVNPNTGGPIRASNTSSPAFTSISIPFGSQYDYDSQLRGSSSQCAVRIVFFGKNRNRDTGANSSDYDSPGLYRALPTDDVILSLGVDDQPCS
ncbi:MAG: prepilin-type N-terminal cleavage/methylation domain-containing protein [Cyanobacteria bacterium P01_H01_bin.15]